MKLYKNIYSKRQTIGVILLLLLFTLISLFSCRKKKSGDEDVSLSNIIIRREKREEEYIDYNDFGSYNFWIEFFQSDKRHLIELEFIVEWAKTKDYFNCLSIRMLPDNSELIKKIQSEDDFDRVKEFLIKNKFALTNDWIPNKRIAFFHEFYFEGKIFGQYCLNFIGEKLKENEQGYCTMVYKRFYSSVTFYE